MCMETVFIRKTHLIYLAVTRKGIEEKSSTADIYSSKSGLQGDFPHVGKIYFGKESEKQSPQ